MIQNIPLGMLDEHTRDAVDKKTDESQQSPLAGFNINCMFMNHKLIQVKMNSATSIISLRWTVSIDLNILIIIFVPKEKQEIGFCSVTCTSLL